MATCPKCAEAIQGTEFDCPHCGSQLRKRPMTAEEKKEVYDKVTKKIDWLVPVRRSGKSIAAGYLAILTAILAVLTALFVWVVEVSAVGIVVATIASALLTGVISLLALKELRGSEKMGKNRAVFGIVTVILACVVAVLALALPAAGPAGTSTTKRAAEGDNSSAQTEASPQRPLAEETATQAPSPAPASASAPAPAADLPPAPAVQAPVADVAAPAAPPTVDVLAGVPPFSSSEISDDDKATATRLNDSGMEKYKSKDWSGAAELFIKALESNPGSITARYNLACTFSLMGEGAKAIAVLQQFKDAGMACEKCLKKVEAAKNDKDFDSLRNDANFLAVVGE